MDEVVDIAQQFSLISNLIRRELELFSREQGISAASARVLNYLADHLGEQIFQRDVERECGIRASTATVLLKKMEAAGLITRRPTKRDRRLLAIHLTGKSRRILSSVQEEMRGIDEAILRGVDKDDAAAFMRVVEQVKHNLTN
ncbi:MarR family winged helix-turn-helix transcriptional regulator [Lacticaseibacillus songhuajiangensis]|jgi:DNA-binding MarR family transcriptional regulator|uniref:MarR family winged helix-turn-helix transcriptional regulator n=1 Tax=Lacticaseibacillus songhuajiangensis TaxID=1296539 RepID=UPI000F7A9FD1|nr:MarR family transcriptional regulator [Lacticaseibacillus songhuajiangensis]